MVKLKETLGRRLVMKLVIGNSSGNLGGHWTTQNMAKFKETLGKRQMVKLLIGNSSGNLGGKPGMWQNSRKSLEGDL